MNEKPENAPAEVALRDWYALQCIESVKSLALDTMKSLPAHQQEGWYREYFHQVTAARAYEMADAMLKERNKNE